MAPLNRIAMPLALVCITLLAYGQKMPSVMKAEAAAADTAARPGTVASILKKLKVSGTVRMRYTASFDRHVDIGGLQHPSTASPYTANAFTIPQARLVFTSDITGKLNIYMRVNFGDFAYLPQSRVLEYAYATYQFKPYLNIRAGLFRPYFGREDDIATDFLKSFDYSNQYTAFSDNGWVSFQMGLSLFGEVKLAEIPLRYYVGVVNGNGRINFSDNDNGKQFPARIEMDLTKELRVGINGGLGKASGNDIAAWGADLNYQKDLSSRWQLEIESEFKQGNNQSLFFSQAIPGRKVKDYMMRGVYVLPSIEYKIKDKKGMGVEASFKYEYLDPDFKQNGNTHQQYVPMVGFDFEDQFAVRLQAGVVIERYNRNIENTTAYNSSRFITQLQLRF